MATRTPARSRSTRWATTASLAVLLAAAGLAGCSSEGSAGGPTTAAKATTTAEATTTTTAPEPEAFTGEVADFYRVPDPLPPGEPGDLVRVQEVATNATEVTVRVMYHSVDVGDHDRAVTGTITYPTGEAPDGGWPVVSWAHGTSGLSSACAPSRLDGAAPTFDVAGVGVATDYIGLGPVGERHGYLSGVSEAHAVVDAVRAARRLPDAHAGTRWVAIGHSQGGHAALFTNELGASYAPELDLLGTVALAPASVLGRTFGPGDQIVPRMVGVMALYGIAADHPELDPDDYVGDAVAAQAHLIDDACADQVIDAMVPIPAATFYDVDPRQVEPAKTLLAENDPGHVAVDAPLLVVGGSADTYVVPARVAALFDQLCEVGQVTELLTVDGATHGSVVGTAAAPVTRWLEARLAGDEPVDSCAGGG